VFAGVILNGSQRNFIEERGLNFSSSGQRLVVGSFSNSNESSGSIK
jgi:hypothetical protein